MNATRKPATDNPSWFKKGDKPWNTGVSVRLSPATEFKRNQKPANYLPVGTVTIRQDKNGKDRAFVKTAEPNQWTLRAVLVWESAHGPVPAGSIVHHEDRDTLNDTHENLILLTRGEHLSEHRSEFEEQRLKALRASRQSKAATL